MRRAGLKPAVTMVALGGLAAGCRDVAGPRPIFSPLVAVYSVLQTDSALVRVVADRLEATGERSVLTGAVGMVTGPGGATALYEASDSLPGCFLSSAGVLLDGAAGCYAGLLPQPPGPGDVITLDLALPAGGSVTGMLVLPEAPVASIPADSQRVTVEFQGLGLIDRLPIAIVPILLDSASGGERVEAVATVVRAFVYSGGGATMDPRRCSVLSAMTPFADLPLEGERDFLLHDVLCAPSGVCFTAWDSLDLSIHVTSMEANYAGYVRDVLESSGVDADRAGFGVVGAVGVFGAVATTVLPLRIVYDGAIPTPGCR